MSDYNFSIVMTAHQADCELVFAEDAARSAVIERLRLCKTPEEQAEAEIWLWGARMALYVIKAKIATKRNAVSLIAAQKQTVKAARADWFQKADGAARTYSHSIRKDAGLIATDTRGGSRKGAGRKADAIADKMSVKPEAPKAETPKAPKAEKPAIGNYKPASPKDAALFARENLAALLQIMKAAGSSEKVVASLVAAMAAIQAELANCQ